MIICHCKVVSDHTVRAVCAAGPVDVDDVADLCGAGTECGGCRRMIQRVVHACTPVPVLLAAS